MNHLRKLNIQNNKFIYYQMEEDKRIKLLAKAIYEIRQLLADALGSENKNEINVRLAAHLSYALHNEDLQILENDDFDIDRALSKIEKIDEITKTNFGSEFLKNFKSTT